MAGLMSSHTYESPLATRNASREMLRLFSAQHKFGLWRRLWLELGMAQSPAASYLRNARTVRRRLGRLQRVDGYARVTTPT